MLAIRVDGNSAIGVGHVARCCSIARAVEKAGNSVVFFVSDEESRSRVEAQGYPACVIGGNFRVFDCEDASLLARSAVAIEADAILVDSYAVTALFFCGLKGLCSSRGVRLGYIDDEYRFESGHLNHPEVLPVDVLVNYSVGAFLGDYLRRYEEAEAALLIGPRYAPVREEFCSPDYRVSSNVGTVLVTTGATNPGKALERIAGCCLRALPDAHVKVVIGSDAVFVDEGGADERLTFVHSPNDIGSLMVSSDLVVSAAGTTLYELATLGVPTIAVPVVENQLSNARGWSKSGFGPSMLDVDWEDTALIGAIGRIAADRDRRRLFSESMRYACDGGGARRIAMALLSPEG